LTETFRKQTFDRRRCKEKNMDELKLNPNESVVLRKEQVGYGNSMFGKNSELILTNQAILLVRKGMFGKTKEILRFELNKIRIVNGQVQVLMGKKDIVTPCLDIYFESGTERFLFTWEQDVQECIDNITAIITGTPLVKRDENAEIIKDLEAFAEMTDSVSESLYKVKKALGIKSHEKIVVRCPSCGASLSGMRGEVSECPYCGSPVKFNP
jgi:hypothetical protein